MRTYVPLNDNGRRAKAAMAPILDEWKQYREIVRRCEQCTDGGGLFDGGAALFARRLQAVQARLQAAMRRNEQYIEQSPALSPVQVMILTLRYVQGRDWPTIAQAAQLDRARLFQEQRVGLNGIDLHPPRDIPQAH